MTQNTIQANLKTEYYLPEKIIFATGTVNSSFLFYDRPRQCGMAKDEECFLLKAGGTILLDFGKELQGGLAISVHLANNSKLHIVFGESVSEAMSRTGEKNSGNMHSLRDYELAVNTMTTFETGNTGFRFVKISADKDIYFNTIQAFCKMQDLEYKGSFICNNELINKIWQTGAYTIHLNMQEYIWDGIKRDRLVWIGDMHPETCTILSVFGDTDCINNTLDFAANDLKNKKWMDNIPSYSMWWLIIQYDLYMHSGNFEYLKSHYETIFKIIYAITEEINSDGSYSFDEMYFVDWSSNETIYQKAGFNAVLILALNTGIKLCDVLGNSSLKNICYEKLSLVKKNKFEYSGNKQVTALNYLSDTLKQDEAEKILIKNGAENLSCFMGFYVLTALGEMGKTDELLDIMHQYWGGMIKMGATTFWEDFDINWLKNAARIDEIVPEGKADIHGDYGKFCYRGFRHSLCHGWASGPTAILSKYILGIYIEEPGCKKVRIAPQLGSLEFAKGSFPTPYGEIIVEHIKKNGEIITKVTAPPDIEIIGIDR